MPPPLWLKHIIGKNTILIRYGPIATLATIFALLGGLSIYLTHMYLDANFWIQVSMDDNTLSSFNTFSVHWSLVGACGHQYTGSSNDNCIQNQFVNNVALYLNVLNDATWNVTAPIGTFDSSTVQNPPPVKYIPGREKLPAEEYDAVLAIDPFLPYTLQKQFSILYYPFDQHSAYVSLLAIDTDSNQSLPISGVIGYGSMVGWIGFSEFYPTTVGGETLYALSLTVYRQKMVKVFALLLVVTNWVLSITILWMTVLVIFRANINDGLILTSTAVLFALPQIRASMPDSPPFGAFIDIAGYFMNVGLVSLCTSILLFSQLQYHYQPVARE
ncbi:hypothetical protein DEU56DRAFT_796550 [Suillus clintonianus]|uniref:uncharacterized protein n=1 Tax=Suillus clintonianus TaxID=1904413 RepID=UPI001B881EF3|nr:uncharacterized protein DEU56DRAFT_796550 [Suillus clintonianus]KAG2140995.1 hypothetical protein DEU56DRAFT_796550 [Suillus clintonianus]